MLTIKHMGQIKKCVMTLPSLPCLFWGQSFHCYPWSRCLHWVSLVLNSLFSDPQCPRVSEFINVTKNNLVTSILDVWMVTKKQKQKTWLSRCITGRKFMASLKMLRVHTTKTKIQTKPETTW